MPGRNRWHQIVVGITVFFALLWLAAGAYVQRAATVLPYDVNRPFKDAFGPSDEELSRKFDSARYAGLRKEAVSLTSAFGYPIRGLLILNPRPARNSVIIGGYTLAVMPIGDLFLDRGFNVLTYYPVTKKTSYGYREKRDLEQVAQWLRGRYPDGMTGAFLASAGAATAIQHAAMTNAHPAIAFYVVHAPFSDLREIVRLRMRHDLGVPNLFWIVTSASVVNWILEGHSFAAVSPRRDVPRVRVPMLFVHAKDDPVIPFWMTEELYAAKPEPRLLWVLETGGHGLPVAPADLTALGRKIDELLAMTR
jgi:pimeloyl-ACP methyl ester carboxylesterase